MPPSLKQEWASSKERQKLYAAIEERVRATLPTLTREALENAYVGSLMGQMAILSLITLQKILHDLEAKGGRER